MSNQLKHATSPYLLQHADNPVDWHTWGSEALELARQQDKPILLSIGYSACHWCHVMAHESFEDQETADVMNRLFVNIKVDREERPDLDKIYQSSHQLLTRRPGGWPLTVFLTPGDQAPFFAGTYFPREARHGLPAFKDLLHGIARAYLEQRDAIRQQNQALLQALTDLNTGDAGHRSSLDAAPLEVARHQLQQSFDSRYGGFGEAPKFPHPTGLERLLRHWAITAQDQPDQQALHMALHTLRHMALGGINDQLGGGFCRYSVDEHWMIPHFEKMLYDNGPLLGLYADAWQISREPMFRDTGEATAGWVMRDMQSADGGYYSSLDADSEGEEGRFYVWERGQIRDLLKPEQYAAFAEMYGLTGPPNFEARWHLHAKDAMEVVAKRLGQPLEKVHDAITSSRELLLRERSKRVPPGRDDKVLTSWNALMIKGMARAGRVLGRDEWVASAERALDFIQATLWRNERLLATYKDGKAHLDAYLDDHAFLIDAILELLQARWRAGDLEFAQALAESLMRRFEDPDTGGFFFTASDHETLIHRPKPMGDDSTPSGNGIAAYTLQRLGHLLGDTRYLEAAEKTLRAAWTGVADVPYAHCALLLALEEHLHPPETIVIRGDRNTAREWQRRATEHFAPNRMVFAIPDSESVLPGLLAQREALGATVAYRCLGTHCSAPITDLATLARETAPSKPLG
jgi:uncharacterized protein YyaL (SSP411 family)